jgi:serpin B
VVLANAVYFKGRWAWPFDARMTGELPFHADGRTSLVPMMRLVHSFGYCEDAGLQVLEIPYRGHALAALIVLPRERDGLRSLERDLKWSALRELMDQVRPRRVALTLPRFKLESGFDLGDPLAGLGMRKAFDPSAADFSGITGRTGDLFLGSVLHRAFAALDEEGTEASAATAAVLVLGRPPEPLPFVVDHPFLFFIRHRSTGGLLFVARVEDPT